MAKREINPLLFQVVGVQPSKGDRVKAQLVESALEVIAEQGIENASFDNIGKKMKMRRSHVAYYFRTKEELLDLILNYITETTQGALRLQLEEIKNPKERLWLIVRAAYSWARDNPNHIAVYLMFYSMAGREKKYQEAFQKIRANGQARVTEALADHTKLSELERSKLSLTIQILVLGSIYESFLKGYLEDAKYMADLEKDIIKHIQKLID